MTIASPGLGPVILATDGSPTAAAAAEVAYQIVKRTGDPLHVAHGWTEVADEDAAQEMVRAAAAELQARGVDVAGVHLLSGSDAGAVAQLADELEAALVVVGWHGLNRFQRLLHPGESEMTVRRTHQPVLVVRSPVWPPSEVVVGYDGSISCLAAAEMAARLAQAFELKLTLAQAVPELSPEATEPAPSDLKELAISILERHAQPLRGMHLADVATEVLAGRAVPMLLDRARENGLLAIGNRGRHKVPGPVLGRHCAPLLERADGPVLVCHSH